MGSHLHHILDKISPTQIHLGGISLDFIIRKTSDSITFWLIRNHSLKQAWFSPRCKSLSTTCIIQTKMKLCSTSQICYSNSWVRGMQNLRQMRSNCNFLSLWGSFIGRFPDHVFQKVLPWLRILSDKSSGGESITLSASEACFILLQAHIRRNNNTIFQ